MPEKIKLLNVGYPKVGNTWIARTLSFALNATFREYDNEGNILPHTNNQDISDRTKGNIPGRDNTEINIIEKTHLLPHEWKNWDKNHNLKIIYIDRDPRDVSVSFFHYKYHHRPFKEHGKIKACGYIEKRKFIFRTIYSYYVHKWLWKTYISGFISYERQWNDTYNALCKLLGDINIHFNEKDLKEAISFFSWDNLIKKRKQGETNNREFMRSGIIGSYKSEFDIIDHVSYLAAFLLSRLFILKRMIIPKVYEDFDIQNMKI